MPLDLPFIKLTNVSLFSREEYGIRDVNFKILKKKRYHMILKNYDHMNAILGILEGRYQPDIGVIYKDDDFFLQSDRLLLGDKVITQEASRWLNLKSAFFFFNGRSRSKQTFIENLKARQVTYFPVYKLKREEKIKFTLLSLLFQGRGIILISELFLKSLSNIQQEHLEILIEKSHNTICFVTHREMPSIPEWIQPYLDSAEKIEDFVNKA